VAADCHRYELADSHASVVQLKGQVVVDRWCGVDLNELDRLFGKFIEAVVTWSVSRRAMSKPASIQPFNGKSDAD
jgi:hypothetical protein